MILKKYVPKMSMAEYNAKVVTMWMDGRLDDREMYEEIVTRDDDVPACGTPRPRIVVIGQGGRLQYSIGGQGGFEHR